MVFKWSLRSIEAILKQSSRSLKAIFKQSSRGLQAAFKGSSDSLQGVFNQSSSDLQADWKWMSWSLQTCFMHHKKEHCNLSHTIGVYKYFVLLFTRIRQKILHIGFRNDAMSIVSYLQTVHFAHCFQKRWLLVYTRLLFFLILQIVHIFVQKDKRFCIHLSEKMLFPKPDFYCFFFCKLHILHIAFRKDFWKLGY